MTRSTIVGLAIGAALIAALVVWGWSRRAEQQAEQPAPARPPAATVELFVVKKTTLPQTISLSGTVRTQQSVSLSTRLSGRITELSVEEGDHVAAGQVVARIDVSNLEAQAGQAAAGIDLAQASVYESQQGVPQAEAGTRAAVARQAELAAHLQEARTAQRQAETDRGRAAYLYKEDAVAKADLDRAESALRMARERVTAAQAAIAQAQAEQSRARAGVQQSQASVERSRAAVEVARSTARLAESELPYGTLRVPFAGVVIRKLAQVGEVTTPGRPLLQIDDVAHLHLEVDTPESVLRSVRIGQKVRVEISSLTRDIDGQVYQIVPSADPRTRTFVVKVRLASTRGLVPGMFGRVLLSKGQRTTSRIPASALVRRGQLVSVFVVDRDNVARMRLVKIKGDGSEVEVLSGLEAGDRIVRRPPATLVEGTPLQFPGETESVR